MATGSEDRAARFRALALPELAYLHRMARGLTGNRQAAEDLVQESIVRGLRYFDSYRAENFRAWMAAIMRNLYRDRPMTPTVPADEDRVRQIRDPAPDPEQIVLAEDRAARLRALVAALPDGLREVLVLREFGGLSYAQIASTLAVPIGTVMSRLARAREDLRAAWFAGDDGCVS
jgi:RNA polymerase sigma-70 factor, ECF subfamily